MKIPKPQVNNLNVGDNILSIKHDILQYIHDKTNIVPKSIISSSVLDMHEFKYFNIYTDIKNYKNQIDNILLLNEYVLKYIYYSILEYKNNNTNLTFSVIYV